MVGEAAYFLFRLGFADDAFKDELADGVVYVGFGFDGREQRVQQASAVDETLAGFRFVHAGNEVGGTVGLPELYLVEHTFHVDGEFHRFL